MQTYFVCIDVAANIPVVLDYSGDTCSDFVLQIVFKRSIKGASEVKFFVYRDGEIVGIKETEMTGDERIISIPFRSYGGADITVDVVNRTDTVDMVITHQSIGVEQ